MTEITKELLKFDPKKKDYYISTNDLLSYLDERIKSPLINDDEKKVLTTIAEKIILRTPAYDVKPVIHAIWINSKIVNFSDEYPINGLYYCSNCRTIGKPYSNYCDCCGASMENAYEKRK